MHRIQHHSQMRYVNTHVMSSSVPVHVYETAVRVAELNGYETMSAFVKDAILDKIQSTAVAMNEICKGEKVLKPSEAW